MSAMTTLSTATEAAPFDSMLDLAQQQTALRWYSLVDLGQVPSSKWPLPEQALCLFGASPDSPVGRQSPWLCPMPRPEQTGAAWHKELAAQRQTPASRTFIAAKCDAEELLAHLQRCLDLKLPDGSDDLQLAYWDPAILGSLLGQPDDTTLHVPGPILGPRQCATLLHDMAAWWYRDREGRPHRVDCPVSADDADAPEFPFLFLQNQVDDLVEAGVPDLVLFHVRNNQPHLLDHHSAAQHYREVRNWVLRARELGLQGLRDLVNLTCIGLIYRERYDSDSELVGLLGQVKAGLRSLDEVMPEMPE